jgi:hypothetical protein
MGPVRSGPNHIDVLLVASGEDSYGARGWSGLFGGFLPQPPVTAAEDSEEASRIIKGRPFEVGFECEAKLYRKEHPYEH